MNKDIISITLLLLFPLYVWNQNHFSVSVIDKLDYPEGIYITKKDFISKVPSRNIPLAIKNRFPEEEIDSLNRRCNFVDKKTGRKIKKVFAVVFNGNLYFRTGAIIKNKNNEDKSLSPATSASNQFVLVLKGANNYLYTEAGIINHWQVGVSAGLASNGIYLANDNGSGFYINIKGVVWDIKNEEFNVFRNCEDFSNFLESKNLENIDCKKKSLTFDEIVKFIDLIK